MKSTDFIKILREVVKREVRSVIREELQTALKPIVTENKTPQAQPTRAPKQFKDITQNTAIENSPIRDILRETAMSQGIPDDEEWQDMGGMMTANQAQAFGHMAQHNNANTHNHSQQAVPTSTDAFVKDYSQVLKSSYEKTNR